MAAKIDSGYDELGHYYIVDQPSQQCYKCEKKLERGDKAYEYYSKNQEDKPERYTICQDCLRAREVSKEL